MAEDNQTLPLAPATIYQYKSDEEFALQKPKPSKPANKCFVYIFAWIVILSAILLVFASIFMRAASPNVKINSITVKDLRYGSSSPEASLNVTLTAEVKIKNANFGRFEFENFTALVLYGDVEVGNGRIDEGHVVARETGRVNVTMEVHYSSGLVNSSKNNLSSDINLGMVDLISYAKLSGRVELMKIIKKRKTPELNCTMALNLTSHAIQDLVCN